MTTLALAGVVAVGSLAVAQPATSPTTAQPASPAKKDGQPEKQPTSTEGEKPASGQDVGKPVDPKDPKKNTQTTESPVSTYVLNHTVRTIDGKDVDLSTYKGKVVVIVNVASKCGFTKQYEGLEELYESRKDKGLVVLGFPANDFGKQEPGTDEEIRQFCDATFHVTFPMFSKVTVKGEGKHPLYAQLAAQEKPIGGEPKWNFTKFVVDQGGNVVARFDAEKAYVGTAKLEPGLIEKVDALLAAKK